jgi:hypothetical protein
MSGLARFLVDARNLGIAAVAAAAVLPAAVAQDNADELAKKLANPVASLISVPLQYNIDFDIGSEDGTKQLLNIQPVIPRRSRSA